MSVTIAGQPSIVIDYDNTVFSQDTLAEVTAVVLRNIWAVRHNIPDGQGGMRAVQTYSLGSYIPVTVTLTAGRGGTEYFRRTIDVQVVVAPGSGEQGPRGPEGVRGPAGPQGPQGPAGPASTVPGPQGPQGPPGADGSDGAQGPAGPQGAVGARGPAGVDGTDGAQGPAGPAGAQGPVGPAGADGSDGAQGPAGPQGPQGPQGPAGETVAGTAQRPITISGGTYTMLPTEHAIQVILVEDSERFSVEVPKQEMTGSAVEWNADTHNPTVGNRKNASIGVDVSLSGNDVTLSVTGYASGTTIRAVYGLTYGSQGPKGDKGDTGAQGPAGGGATVDTSQDRATALRISTQSANQHTIYLYN